MSEDSLSIDLVDGRTIAVPLAWYPRLVYGTAQERDNWRLIGRGEGIHWPDLDEDISISNLLRGRTSGESQTSFKRWLAHRNRQQCHSEPCEESLAPQVAESAVPEIPHFVRNDTHVTTHVTQAEQ